MADLGLISKGYYPVWSKCDLCDNLQIRDYDKIDFPAGMTACRESRFHFGFNPNWSLGLNVLITDMGINHMRQVQAPGCRPCFRRNCRLLHRCRSL